MGDGVKQVAILILLHDLDVLRQVAINKDHLESKQRLEEEYTTNTAENDTKNHHPTTVPEDVTAFGHQQDEPHDDQKVCNVLYLTQHPKGYACGLQVLPAMLDQAASQNRQEDGSTQ